MTLEGQALGHINESDGYVAGFHDASITSIYADIGGRFTLCVRLADRGSAIIDLKKACSYGMHNVHPGTIIFRVYAWRLSEAPHGALRPQDGAWTILLGSDWSADMVSKEAVRLAQKRPSDWLVSIETVDSGAIAVVCETPEFRSRGHTDAATVE